MRRGFARKAWNSCSDEGYFTTCALGGCWENRILTMYNAMNASERNIGLVVYHMQVSYTVIRYSIPAGFSNQANPCPIPNHTLYPN